ncbi:MAG: pentapeptide repeat-containing protein [Saprospiraceae bacterium]|nr:pentapeptide repeat-containing protein [Saprospiraceae bacterium]
MDPKKEESPGKQIDIWSRTIVALLLGVLMGAIVALVGLRTLESYLPHLIVGFIALILIGAVLSFVIVQNKEAVLKRLFGVSDADLGQVKGMAQLLFMNIWNKDFKTAENTFNALFAKTFAWYSWMNFRRWIVMVFQTLFVGFGGLLGTLLLYNQNKLLTQQNDLLTIQNTRLSQQTYLQEAERRSALILLMGNLLDALDNELKEDIGQKGIRDLSPQLIGRIIALSSGLKPYRYLENDSMIQKEISPERGQLLLSILSSEVDNGTLRRIFQSADFSFSELQGAALAGEFLEGINLREADLSKANLNGTRLAGADLNKADLSASILAGTDLRKANLSETDLRETYITEVDFRGASLYGTDLRGVDLSDSDLRRSFMREALLDSTIVPDFHWLEAVGQLQRDSIVGIGYLNDQYYLDSVETDPGNFEYILLRKKSAADSLEIKK